MKSNKTKNLIVKQASVRSEDNRWYTYTIKPCKTEYKGDSKSLHDKFIESTVLMDTISFEYVVEKRGTLNEHIHALIQVEKYIPNKMIISKDKRFYGYSIKFDIIRKEYEDDIMNIYTLYMKKEMSDSERIENQYGNLFLPVNDQE